ncbi:NAD-dependent epimerase/dehydratase family protein [Clostridium botulinum]|uniref:UDP-glucose 4-epimerase n=1 Tax=Clostridium botulinum TaxID=1491 RepID=A0A846J5K1_CLOBO|nr:GDP-mannose 4,6-dehydratase [Clostridium botulinum]ACA54427.1 NAD-dependent epimerase/dehydratase family protein [Clostridium botulinum A3 str. Loch Maree]NFH64696.1 NAD-dependent epimerase/dehydratase family protein [Clostridium botulinum]NFJ08510.1 NAD-dependent epimerase/dehydratase family protein [Clostridium botulinum]NFK14906.1 NAD-dependent epimerase/dehydratase family protein [Clostridium botulinum]NFM95240.1 NAD-dependent epimerase/dehydratase family protein [Clostridium botulinum]
MKVLVSGGAGFIGSNLVDKLINLGHNVCIIDNLSTGNINNVNKKAQLYINDILDPNVSKIFEKEKFDIVYHLAAQIDVQKSIANPIFDSDVNVCGTINIINNCVKYNVKKIVYSSSAAVYGHPQYLPIDEAHGIRPISYYGLSKYTAEEYIRVFSNLNNLDFTILRYANVYGIRQDPKGEGGVISIFMNSLFKKQPLYIFGDGSALRDYIFVEDIVDTNIAALSGGGKERFNIGTGVYTSVKELAENMIDIIGLKCNIEYAPARKGDIANSYFNISKAKNKLNWIPKFSLKDGLKKTIEYYKNNLED